jgi:hypothetical protein
VQIFRELRSHHRSSSGCRDSSHGISLPESSNIREDLRSVVSGLLFYEDIDRNRSRTIDHVTENVVCVIRHEKAINLARGFARF